VHVEPATMSPPLLTSESIENELLRSDTKHHGTINAMATNSEYLYTAMSDGMLTTWNLETLQPLHSVRIGNKSLLSVAADSHHVYVGGSYIEDILTVLRREDTSHLVSIRCGHGSIMAIVDGRTEILTASSDGTIDIWKKGDWKRTGSMTSQHKIALCLHIDSHHIFAGGIDDFVSIFNLDTHSHIQNLYGHNADIFSIWSDQEYLYSGSGEVWWGGPGSPRPPSFEAATRVWDKSSWNCVTVLEGHRDNVNAIRSDGSHIYSVSDDGSVRAYKKEDWTQTGLTLGRHPIKALVQTEKFLYTSVSNEIVRIPKSILVQ
jgi:WD40 repeat protein